MTTQNPAEKIAALISQCKAEAIKQGFSEDEHGEYQLSAEDYRWIIDQLGSRPTGGQWHEAGEIAGIPSDPFPVHCAHYVCCVGNHVLLDEPTWEAACQRAREALSTKPVAPVSLTLAEDELKLLLAGNEAVPAGLALELVERGWSPSRIFQEYGQIDLGAA